MQAAENREAVDRPLVGCRVQAKVVYCRRAVQGLRRKCVAAAGVVGHHQAIVLGIDARREFDVAGDIAGGVDLVNNLAQRGLLVPRGGKIDLDAVAVRQIELDVGQDRVGGDAHPVVRR